MTHTLHRLGSVESLRDDYIVLITRSKEMKSKLLTHKPLSSFGPSKLFKGMASKFLERNPKVRSVIRKALLRVPKIPKFPGVLGDVEKTIFRSLFPPLAIFTDKTNLASYLKRLKNMNMGSSVVVSGLFEEVNDCLKKIGICPHTVEFSLGIFGKKELLPREELLQITTMCGHHMISPRLVEKLHHDVNKGRSTYENAAAVMAKQCVCRAFNKKRAIRLMKGLAADQ